MHGGESRLAFAFLVEAMEALFWSIVHYPDHCPPRPSTGPQAAVIYLPRGPLLDNRQHDDLNLAELQSTLPFPVICIHYRCGNENKHPTAIHDVIAGYDWVVQNLFSAHTSTNRFAHKHAANKVAVLGELLGGSLAATLALTECRTHEPTAVVAAAISNPITNWVGLDEDDQAKPCSVDHAQPTLQQFHRLRNSLFRHPADYFDPFASPALFFRAAGSQVPLLKPPLSDMEELAALEQQDFFRSQLALSAVPNLYASTETGSVSNPGQETTTRKSSRRFPSKSLALRLPRFRITSGKDSIISEQSEELVRLLDKAARRQSKAGTSPTDSSRVRLGIDSGEIPAAFEMVVHEEVDGFGIWDASETGRSRMRDTALWVEQALR